MKFQVFETSEPKFPDVYSTSNEVYESMKHYQKAGREMFFILFLNTKNRMIDAPVFLVLGPKALLIHVGVKMVFEEKRHFNPAQ